MSSADSVNLILLYMLFSGVILYSVIKNIKKMRKISIKAFFELYFFLVYGLVPIVMLIPFQDASMDINNGFSYFHTIDPKYYYWLFVITVVFYAIYKLSDLFFSYRRKNVQGCNDFVDKVRKKIDVSSDRFFVITVIFSLLGIMSLILWSKAFGGPLDIIRYANAIRSGHSPIQNSLTFLKPLCGFSIIGFYNNLIMLKKTKFKILNIVFLVANLVFSVIFLLANDSRMFILVFFMCIFLYYKNKNLRINIKLFLTYVCLAIIALFTLGKLDSITYLIRNGEDMRVTDESSAIESGISEFGFTYRNGVNVLYFYDNNLLPEMHEMKDIKNIVMAWVPERFKTDKEYLGDLNTSYYYGATGGIPTDIVTASIYKFHLFGIIIMPIFMAILLNAIEKFFKKYDSAYMFMVYNVVGCNVCLRLVAYYDLANNIFSSFYIIVPTFVFCVFCANKRKELDKNGSK